MNDLKASVKNNSETYKGQEACPLDLLVIVRNGLPKWWNEDDTEACQRHYQCDLTDWYSEMRKYDDMEEYYSLPISEQEQAAVDEWCDQHIDKFTCRRCENWKSNQGDLGYCSRLDRKTQRDNTSEEWHPKAKLRKQMELAL